MAATAETIVLDAPRRRSILGWTGLILLIVNFAAPNGGFIGIPLSFFLKNRLHLQAHELAVFNLWTGAPLYAAFLFGFLRDHWSPFGRGDRGHLVLFGVLTAAVYGAVAFLHPVYAVLFGGVIVGTVALQTVGGAANGLLSDQGQAHRMAGQASAVINLANCAPAVAAYLLGGVLSDLLEGARAPLAARALFLVAAALMLVVVVLGALAPARLFQVGPRAHRRLLPDAARLLRHWPVYPPLIMLLLWDFSPAGGTVIQYHLANALHASDAQVGAFFAIFYGSCAVTLLLYGWLCQRVRLGPLLWWATLVAIPQWTPLLFVHSAAGALIWAAPIGLMGGLASAAYVDLAIRSCPEGLQGTMIMLVVGTLYYVAGRFGDLWGTQIYDRGGGFSTAVIVTTVVYALILPVILLAPRRLVAIRDGESGGLSFGNGSARE